MSSNEVLGQLIGFKKSKTYGKQDFLKKTLSEMTLKKYYLALELVLNEKIAKICM